MMCGVCWLPGTHKVIWSDQDGVYWYCDTCVEHVTLHPAYKDRVVEKVKVS